LFCGGAKGRRQAVERRRRRRRRRGELLLPTRAPAHRGGECPAGGWSIAA
jgi:hypothetical protein